MTKLLSSRDIDISQRNFQQIIIRGDGKDRFNQIINKEISIIPPSKNLEVTINDKFMFAKNSFDQWSLIYLVEQNYKEILKFKNVIICNLPFLFFLEKINYIIFIKNCSFYNLN